MQYSYDNTGVGGNYNTYNPVAQNLIVDSLAYWRDTMGVDGFRFDLGSVLGNTCTVGCFNFSSTDSNTALNRILRELPQRPAAGGSGIDLYAEPWAIGGNSYQLGGFPAGLVGMERQLSRHAAPGAERSGRGHHHHRPVGDAPRRFVRPVRQPQAVELDQFHGRARRLHAQRPV